MRRGVTLIELMITVAVISVGSFTVGHAAMKQRLDGQETLQRARAEQLLAYSAERAAAGLRGDEAVLAQLVEGLPNAAVQVAGAPPTLEVTVRWGARTAQHRRSVVVFARKAP